MSLIKCDRYKTKCALHTFPDSYTPCKFRNKNGYCILQINYQQQLTTITINKA